jgi:hypothetical protein
MKMIRGKRQDGQAERTDGTGGPTLSRRRVLGGLAALPVVYGVGSATPALAATAIRPGRALRATDGQMRGNGTDDLVRGVERRYNAPLLTPGTRLVLPAGIKAVAVEDYYRHPHLASTATAWPQVTASDGRTVDASVVPEPGAPTSIAVLSGFSEGWYELAHTSGRADRVTWDARKLPYLFVHREFGGTDQEPIRSQFYTLALQPMSRNPYLRSTSIL